MGPKQSGALEHCGRNCLPMGIAAKVISQLKHDGLDVAPPVFLPSKKQVCTPCGPPLIFNPAGDCLRWFHQQLAREPLPPNARRLSTPPRGFDAGAGEVESKVTVGVYRSPEEFVSEAISIGHPTRMHSMFPDEISDVCVQVLEQRQSPDSHGKDRRNQEMDAPRSIW